MSFARHVAVSTAASWLRYVAQFAVQLALLPFIIRTVGAADYGIWALTMSVLGFFMLLDFGLAPGVVKYVAQAKGSGDPERRNRMLSTIALAYSAAAFIGFIGLALLALYYDQIFGIAAADRGKAIALVLILGSRAILFSLLLGLFRAALFGEQRIALINGVQVVSTVAVGAGSWLVLAQGHGIVALGVVHAAVLLVEHVAYVVLSYRAIKDLHISWRLAERGLLKEATSFGLFQFFVSVSGLIVLRSGPIIIKLFLSLEAVALYAVAQRMAENIHLLVKQFINVMSSLSARLKGSGDDERIRILLVTGAKLATAPAAMLAAGAWAFAREALVAWVGPEFEGAAPVLVILMTAVALDVPLKVITGVFSMTGLHRFTTAVAVAGVLLNLAVSVALVRPLGILGVAAGTLVSSVVVHTTLGLAAACRRMRLSYWSYLRQVFLPALLPAVAQVGAGMALKAALPPAGLGMVTLEAAATMPVYVGLFWLLLGEQERATLIQRLRPHARPRRPGVDPTAAAGRVPAALAPGNEKVGD